MELRILRDPVKGLFKVTLKVKTNDTEDGKIGRLGNPTVEIGGSFSGGDPVIDFSLASASKKIPSEFPVVQSFDGDELGFELAEKQANVWAEEMYIRMKNAMAEFKALPDTFTDDSVFTI